MDLSKYGIHLELNASTNLDAIDYSYIEPAKRFENSILVGNTNYTLLKILGKGSYGVTYLAKDHKNSTYALKIVQAKNASAIQECIVHILLFEESAELSNGPFVPAFYGIGYNVENQETYIVSEKLDGTFESLIVSNKKPDNDRLIPDALLQLSEILTFFGNRLKFNHRDFKPDNIMYSKSWLGTYRFKLIDFGLSCLNFRGLPIHVEGLFPKERVCYKEDRDLPQCMYSLLMFYGKYISHNLQDRLNEILVSYIHSEAGQKDCHMFQGCENDGLKTWANAYTFLNRKNITVPSAKLRTLKTHMNNFKRGKPFAVLSNQKRLTRNNRKLNTHSMLVSNSNTNS